MDALWKMERTHRIIERFGGQRRDRAFVEVVSGEPGIFVTGFDGERMCIRSVEFLPSRLIGGLSRLASIRESWIDILPHQSSTRRHNIITALENLERLVSSISQRALHCKGSRYTVFSAVDIMIDAVQRIANFPEKVDGVAEDAVFEKAALRIWDLLRSAGCAHAIAA